MPPRGLRLFVRPIESSDSDALAAFLRLHDPDGAPPSAPQACGLLGKLLGDIVAVVSLDVAPDALRVERIVVAPHLRRKWIGRLMIGEVEQLAAKLDRARIVVDDPRDAQEFFRRVGFESEGERWVRAVASSQPQS